MKECKHRKCKTYIQGKGRYCSDECKEAERLARLNETMEKLRKTCPECGASYTSRYAKYCSEACREVVSKRNADAMRKPKTIKEKDPKGRLAKWKETMLERYGPEMLKSPVILKKREETLTKKHGSIENHLANINAKRVETITEKYGEGWELLYERRRANYYKELGQTHPITNETLDKRRNTMLERYGVSHNILFDFNAEYAMLKHKQGKTQDEVLRMMEIEGEHGVYGEWHDKSYFFYPKQPKVFNRREAHRKMDGSIIRIQGYEGLFLSSLDRLGIEYVAGEELRWVVPYYNLKSSNPNRIHHYHPDVYIPEGNIIFEVKSEYTYAKELEKNKLKARACIDAGYDFRFVILDGMGRDISLYVKEKYHKGESVDGLG